MSPENRSLIKRVAGLEASLAYNPMSHFSINAFDRLLDAARQEGRDKEKETK